MRESKEIRQRLVEWLARSELSTRRGRAFEDYTAAVRNLGEILDLTSADLDALAQLPGFRNVVARSNPAPRGAPSLGRRPRAAPLSARSESR